MIIPILHMKVTHRTLMARICNPCIDKISKRTNMECTKCEINTFSENRIFDTEVYEDSHDFANIVHCNGCSALFLEYWVEIFDDGWRYWVRIDKDEVSDLLQFGKEKHPKFPIIEFIKSKKELYSRSPSFEYRISSPNICWLDGPAW